MEREIVVKKPLRKQRAKAGAERSPPRRISERK
jgi:hypothetical protein